MCLYVVACVRVICGIFSSYNTPVITISCVSESGENSKACVYIQYTKNPSNAGSLFIETTGVNVVGL